MTGGGPGEILGLVRGDAGPTRLAPRYYVCMYDSSSRDLGFEGEMVGCVLDRDGNLRARPERRVRRALLYVRTLFRASSNCEEAVSRLILQLVGWSHCPR